MSQVKHVAAGEGRRFTVIGGDVMTLKAVGGDTDESYAVIETLTPPQAGPPPHIHHREDESFYVLEGEFEFTVGKQAVRATKGSFVVAPRGIPHGFKNVSPAPGRLLVIVRPAGFEKFIEEFAELPPDAPPDFAKMAVIGARYGIEFV